MGTIRLGKRTEGRAPLIRDFVPLADARRPRLRRLGSDSRRRLRPRRSRPACSTGTSTSSRSPTSSRRIKPMPAVFDQNYVKRLDGTNVKTGQDQAGPGRGAAEGHPRLQGEARLRPAGHGLVRLDRDLHQPGPGALDARGVREGDGRERPDHRAVDALRLRRASWRACPFANGAPNLTCDFPAMEQLAKEQGRRRSAARTSRPARRW